MPGLFLYPGSLIIRTLCIAALAGIAAAFLRNAAMRHALWVTVLAGMLLMPLLDTALPASMIPAWFGDLAARREPVFQPFQPTSSSRIPALGDNPVADGPEDTLSRAAFILYMCVAGALLVRFGAAYAMARLLKQRSRQVAIPCLHAISAALRWSGPLPGIHESEAVRVPLTIGVFAPAVVLPADWTAWDGWKLRAVLCHELTHIRRADWAVALWAGFATCVLWFNPLSWWLERRLSALGEEACDDASLVITGDAARYAEVLLEFAAAARGGRRLQMKGVPMARQKMRTRIERVLSAGNPGSGVLSRTRWVLLAVAAAPLLYLASSVHVASVTPALAAPVFVPLKPPEISARIGREGGRAREAKAAGSVAVRRARAALPEAAKAQTSTAGPRVVRQVEPVFPPLARAARIQGVVIVTVTVGADGRLADAAVRTGHPLFRAAAIDAVRQWTFEGSGVADVPVVFRLSERDKAEIEASRRESAMQSGNSAAPSLERGRIAVNIMPDGRAYWSQRRPLPPEQRSEPFVFTLSGLKDRTLSFESASGPAVAFSYGCDSCVFYVTDDGVGPQRPDPGVFISLRPDPKEMDVTCAARECSVTTVLTSGGTFIQTLAPGQSTLVQTSARITISFARR